MKKALLLVMVLTPVWLCAQQKVIQFTSTSGSVSSYALSSIRSHVFEADKMVTNFNNSTETVETMFSELSKVTFGTNEPGDGSKLASNASSTDYCLFPMPVQDELSLRFDATSSANAKLQVLTLDGRIVLNRTEAVVSGTNTLELNVSTLSQGIYICRLSYGDEQYTQQIIKK